MKREKFAGGLDVPCCLSVCSKVKFLYKDNEAKNVHRNMLLHHHHLEAKFDHYHHHHHYLETHTDALCSLNSLYDICDLILSLSCCPSLSPLSLLSVRLSLPLSLYCFVSSNLSSSFSLLSCHILKIVFHFIYILAYKYTYINMYV